MTQFSPSSVLATPSTTLGGSTFLRKSTAVEVVQILAPASNVNGVKIRLALTCADGAAGTQHHAIFADTAAPSAVDDMTKRPIMQSNAAPAGPGHNVLRDVIIPAGNGLWFATDTVGPSVVMVSYDIL